MGELRELAMFPLSTVVYPHQRVPLHVFEQRYRRLVEDVREGEGHFGICLIARGSEVGGGDQRVDVGTIVDLRAVFPFSDGRCMLIVDGRERLFVRRWLVDDPYPRALVQVEAAEPVEVDGDLLAAAHQAVRALRRLHSEMFPDSCLQDGCECDDDPVTRVWQLCSMTPMATLDQMRLLRLDGPNERLAGLLEICCERYGDLTRQLHDGPGDPS